MTSFINEDIGGFDVSVDDSLGMGSIQSIRNLYSQLQQLIDFNGTACHSIPKGLAFQVLHDNEGLSFMLTNVIDGADIGMIECRCRTSFSLKVLQCLAVPGELLGQKFQGNISTQASVLGPVNHTHPSGTDLLQDFVVRYGLADHVRGLSLPI